MLDPIPVLVRAGVPADRIVRLRDGRWAVLDLRGAAVAGIRYEEPVFDPRFPDFPDFPWLVYTREDQSGEGMTTMNGTLADMIEQVVELVRNYDEAES